MGVNARKNTERTTGKSKGGMFLFTVGVVGPRSSVERIISAAKILNSNIKFIPCFYSEIKETEKLVREYETKMDVWLFSGKVSYLRAYSILGNKDRLVYIEHTEAGIYKALLEFSFQQQVFMDRLSIDELTTTHLDNALNQLNIPSKQLHTRTFDFETITAELLDFHRELWNKGQTVGALTCFEEVYEVLKKEGIPIYRISTTDKEIEQTLKIIQEKRKTSYFKGIQTGVQFFEIKDYERKTTKLKSSYHIQYMELKLKEILLKYCERLNSSFIEKAPGQYLIFSSHKALEHEIETLYATMQQLSLEANTPVNVGIGFGETLYSAEINALQALNESKEKGENKVVIIQESGEKVIPVNIQDKIIYSDKIENEVLVDRLNKLKVNVKNFNALVSFTRKTDMDEFTVKEIASKLYWDKRNTQRFFDQLCDAELLKCVGERNYSKKGRPSRIYKLNISSL